MRRKQPLLKALIALSEAPNGELLSGRLTRPQRQALEQFRAASRCISTRRQGAGLLYVVEDEARLKVEIDALSPGHGVDLSDAPSRARNIALRRDSKAGASALDVHYLPIKAIGPGVAWAGVDQELSLSAVPHPHAASLGISPGSPWTSTTQLLLVENRELFDVLSWVPADFRGTVAWYGGEAPGWLLSWLGEKHRCPSVLHFPDFDGVGLSTFVKLRKLSLSPVDLYLPGNWKRLLRRFGNRDVFTRTLPRFEAVFSALCAIDPAYAELARELRQAGLALEQESVLVPPAA